MIRCFLAINFSEPVKAQIKSLQESLARSGADVRWVRPEGVHLTLKFFGQVPEQKIPLIAETTSQIAQTIAPFVLEFFDLGAFPSFRRPKVIWIGLRGDLKSLIELQKGLEQAYTTLGFPPEKRPFVPHVTLGRVKSPKRIQRLQEQMEKSRSAVGLGWEKTLVKEIVLYKSVLKPSGAEYTPLATLSLQRKAPKI